MVSICLRELNFQNPAPTPPCNACSIWSHAGGIDADDQTPTKIIFDPLFSRFNDEFRRNERSIQIAGSRLSKAKGDIRLVGRQFLNVRQFPRLVE